MVGSEDAQGVRVERDDHGGGSGFVAAVGDGAANHRLMAEMHAVKDADGEVRRAEGGELVGRAEEFQAGRGRRRDEG